MLYSKNRKNLARGRTKRSKLMSFINNRFRIQDEKWEDVHFLLDKSNNIILIHKYLRKEK